MTSNIGARQLKEFGQGIDLIPVKKLMLISIQKV